MYDLIHALVGAKGGKESKKKTLGTPFEQGQLKLGIHFKSGRELATL